MAEQPPQSYTLARQIVCEEWQRSVTEFKLLPGSTVEKVVGRIISRFDWELRDAIAAEISAALGQGTEDGK